MKKVIILNGGTGVGKDTFYKMVSKIIPSMRYSITSLPIELCEIAGYDNRVKSEKNKEFVHQMKLLLEWYNDTPFTDISGVIKDFFAGYYDEIELLFVDITESKDIERAVKVFDAVPVLIRKDDNADVDNYSVYKYIINNNGLLEDLYDDAKCFVEWLRQ